MTQRISRTMFAAVLAFGMLAAFSSPSRAALSSAERTDAVVAPAAPAPEKPMVTASAPAQAVPAATAPVAATSAPVAQQPRKAVASKVKPRRIASVSRGGGYPCH